MKTIVTHISVDLDAITSVWMIIKYLPDWQDAELKFVNAGKTLNNIKPDDDPNIIHVDTGLGKFDHHQIFNYSICAATKVFEYLMDKSLIKKKDAEALKRIIDIVTSTDHFQEIYFPNPESDIYDLCIYQTATGLRSVIKDDRGRCEIMFKILDATLQVFKNKITAEEEIKKAYIFKSKLGKTLAIESQNEETIKLAQKSGYETVIRKDPVLGFLRIKTIPSKKYDLTPVYKKLIKQDPEADWFLHISKNMLLNGSSKILDTKASRLTLNQVIDIIKNI